MPAVEAGGGPQTGGRGSAAAPLPPPPREEPERGNAGLGSTWDSLPLHDSGAIDVAAINANLAKVHAAANYTVRGFMASVKRSTIARCAVSAEST